MPRRSPASRSGPGCSCSAPSPRPRPPRERGRLQALQARAASRNGEVEQAHRLFLSAAELVGPEAPAEALELLAEAVEVDGYTGDLERLTEVRAQMDRLVLPEPDERQRFLLAWISVNDAALRRTVTWSTSRRRSSPGSGARAARSGRGSPRCSSAT